MTTATPVACRHCRRSLLLLPYKDRRAQWCQAVVCARCDSLKLMPRGEEVPDE